MVELKIFFVKMAESRYISFFISATGDSFQCDEMNQFLKAHVVIRILENVINSGNNPGIQLLIEYKDDKTINNKNKERIDYRSTLNTEQQKTAFDKLKEFRTELYKKEKLPAAYMVCKDEHLATIVRNPDITQQEIFDLPNSGNIRLKQYAKEIFEKYQEILRELSSEENGVPF